MPHFKAFKAQSGYVLIFKHKELPVYLTTECSFFRCVEFKNDFYGRTVSKLFEGNLRLSNQRYSALFPDQKISYWADSIKTARAEIKKHGSGCDILTFCAYDDASSSFPCLGNDELLVIVDGRKTGIQSIIDKVEDRMVLTEEEKETIDAILRLPIDAIAYDSRACLGGENYIFLEKGFKKLFLRELRLRFGRKSGGSHDSIDCSVSCDYRPIPKEYGKYFAPKCRIKMDEEYLKTEEYLIREKNLEEVLARKYGIKNDKRKSSK